MKIFKNLEARLEQLQQHSLTTARLQQSTLMTLSGLRDLLLQSKTNEVHANHPNPLNRFGRKCFSQTDEDGIKMEIGANAFFVRTDMAHLFADVPADINQIYVAPRYYLNGAYGHSRSPRVVEEILNK